MHVGTTEMYQAHHNAFENLRKDTKIASLTEASFPSKFQLFSTYNSNRYPHLPHLHGVGQNATVASRAFLYSDAQWRHPGNLNTPARLGIKTWDGGGEREAWTVWWLE
jgi:hypothetical protein